MPRNKVYTEPRSPILFRIDTAKYDKACARAKELGYSTFNKYLEHLLDDDLLLQAFEQRQAILAQEKVLDARK